MSKSKAFTLIEILIVIAVIGILSGIIWMNTMKAEEKAVIAKVQAEIDSIAKAMYLFRFDHGEFPPIGDNCSACSNPCGSSWTIVMDDLINGGYLSQRIDKDPWGNYFCYDDNDNVCCGGCSPIYSMGPNEINDSWFNCPREDGCPKEICGDDIGKILPFRDRPYPW